MQLPTKWNHFGTSIFSTMTQLANRSGAINLAQGFPDFDGPQTIKDAAIAAIQNGPNQYAPSTGLPVLRELLAQRCTARTGLIFNPETEVTIFSGATEAIFCAFQAFFEPGDEILAFAPYFDCYPPAAYGTGAKIVGVDLQPPEFTFSEALLQAAISKKTRGILINSPHNPTGRVLTTDELNIIRKVVLQHDLLVLTDEVYEELVFAPAKHISFATLPQMAERTITISSTSKTYSMTGWKVGYAFAPAALTKTMRAVHQFTVFCSASPLQAGMTAALKLKEDYFSTFRRDYQERRDLLFNILTTAGFSCLPPQGSYFILANYSKLSDKPDLEFTRWLTEEVKVAAVPISVFYDDQVAAAKTLRYVRFAFCKGLATLRAAEEKFKSLSR